MSQRIPLIILDYDDEDEIQITGVAVCANNRINLDPGCSKGVSNPSSSQQTGDSSDGNIDQQVVTRQTHGIAHSSPPRTTEWLQSIISTEHSPYFPPPLLSPTNSLAALGSSGENNQVVSLHPDNALAESTASAGQETRVKHASSNLQFTKQFFTDMADTIAHIFPYGEFACKYKCSIDQVNRALIAVVLGPLTKRNEQGSYENGNEEEEGNGQVSVEKEEGGGPNLLIKKWNKQYQAMACEGQRESEGRGLPIEFEQILFAASGNAEAYWKERNAAFDAYKAFQDARKNERAEEGTAVREVEYQNLQQQLEEMAKAAEQEHTSSKEAETTSATAISLHEKEAKDDGSTTSSRKRARSSSETVDGKDITGGRDGSKSVPPSQSTATSPAIYQLSSPPPWKKVKIITYPSTPTQTSTGKSITPTPGQYHPNPKHLVATDGSSDTYILNNFFNGRSNNAANRPTPSPSSSGSSFTSPSPTAQTPTPLPRSRSLPNTSNPNPISIPNPANSLPRSSPPPSYFTRSARRHPVTIDKFGNYQHEKQNQDKHQYSTSTSHNNNMDAILPPRLNGLLRRRARNQGHATDSGDECDFHDPYCNAGVDQTTRVFTEGLWGELFGGFKEEEGERELVGLEFGLEQIEVSRKGKGKGRMIGDYGGDVSGKGAGEGEESEDDAGGVGLNDGDETEGVREAEDGGWDTADLY
ncbi:hypothetical protein EMCG_05803 [[Emmonsia] crescens]|uniref:Uncharacterized protein n=1 Tax=[Emmonsia] crescens TaxID=73230 RepID=A0A0G2J7J4_9EURO|nr:hypothetical protein EMCG_05803 [Emmonsia crescens UAMH 3008]